MAACFVATLAAPSAAGASVINASFNGGSLTGLAVDPAFSQGSFQNLSYRYEECGTEPAEETCTWELRVNLFSDPSHRCTQSTPESQLLWDTGAESGNGAVESGAINFALEGCKGQILSVFYEAHKTFNPEEEEGPWKRLSSGSSAPLLSIVIGAESAEEIEARIRAANPAAQIAPAPQAPTLAVSSDCHWLKIGNRRYSFAFHQMGCRKATNLATMAHLSGAAPSGYACQAKRGEGRRCWRRGHPEKFVEWRLPTRPSQAQAGS